MTDQPSRCTERGCPVRYRGGPSRPCPQHQDDGADLAARMATLGAAMAAPGAECEDQPAQ